MEHVTKEYSYCKLSMCIQYYYAEYFIYLTVPLHKINEKSFIQNLNKYIYIGSRLPLSMCTIDSRSFLCYNKYMFRLRLCTKTYSESMQKFTLKI